MGVVKGGYIPVQGSYIPVQGGYIPVQGSYIAVQGGYILIQWRYIAVQGGYIPLMLTQPNFLTPMGVIAPVSVEDNNVHAPLWGESHKNVQLVGNLFMLTSGRLEPATNNIPATRFQYWFPFSSEIFRTGSGSR